MKNKCSRCVLPADYPGIRFDENGICNFCHAYVARKEEQAADYFAHEVDLIEALRRTRLPEADYDVLVPLSGGVDSSYTLIRIVEDYGLRPLAFHNDHGYEDETATQNVRKLCRALDVDLLLWQHDYAFMKKLWRYLNGSRIQGLSACYLCGNILYLNAVELAHRFNVKMVINGYSKGQAAIIRDREKGRRLLGELFNVFIDDQAFSEVFMKKYAWLEKQVIFEKHEDLTPGAHPDKILVIPFFLFKFHRTDKEVLKKICRERFDWQPMQTSYPARTTNCDMIWLNTHMDLCKMGYTIYHDEYAELVRAGEISREQALRDLDYQPPEGIVGRLAAEIGLDLDAALAQAPAPEQCAPAIEEQRRQDEAESFNF